MTTTGSQVAASSSREKNRPRVTVSPRTAGRSSLARAVEYSTLRPWRSYPRVSFDCEKGDGDTIAAPTTPGVDRTARVTWARASTSLARSSSTARLASRGRPGSISSRHTSRWSKPIGCR